jgi:hypothetical protein
MKLARTNAIIPLPTDPEAPLLGREGYAVVVENGNVYILGTATDICVFGVLLESVPFPAKASVAVAAGGLAGTVRVKLVQAADPGGFLQLVHTPDGCAFGPDCGLGVRIVMAQALESGAVGELIEAVLFKPIYYAS